MVYQNIKYIYIWIGSFQSLQLFSCLVFSRQCKFDNSVFLLRWKLTIISFWPFFVLVYKALQSRLKNDSSNCFSLYHQHSSQSCGDKMSTSNKVLLCLASSSVYTSPQKNSREKILAKCHLNFILLYYFPKSKLDNVLTPSKETNLCRFKTECK